MHAMAAKQAKPSSGVLVSKTVDSKKEARKDETETPDFNTLHQEEIDYLKAEGIRVLKELMEKIDASLRLDAKDFVKFQNTETGEQIGNLNEADLKGMVGKTSFLDIKVLAFYKPMKKLLNLLKRNKMGIYLHRFSEEISTWDAADKVKVQTLLAEMNQGRSPSEQWKSDSSLIVSEIKQTLAELYCELLIKVFSRESHSIDQSDTN